MGWVQDVKNSVRNLGNLGEKITKNYYHYKNNPGNGTQGSERGMRFEFIGYSSEHFRMAN